MYLGLDKTYFIAVVLAICARGENDTSAMVAFMCGRPAMHLTYNGWTKDDTTGCLTDSAAILNYCRKMYPGVNVRSVVQSDKRVTVHHWCHFGQNHCQDEFVVFPYHCHGNGPHLHVEMAGRKIHAKDGGNSTKNVNKPVTTSRKWNEHEYYLKAKNDMNRYHHDKVVKMMKEWAAARQHVENLKSVDIRASEKLSKEVTTRFQKMYKAEEEENELERKQLEELHQLRIQSQLNSLKQKAFSNFMTSIDAQRIQPLKVVRSMRQLIKTLQKDRVHIVTLFTHLLETDPAAAHRKRKQTTSQLNDIDELLKRALHALDHVKKQKTEIKKQIEMDLENYHAFDDSISALLQQPSSLETSSAHTTITPTTAATEATLEDDDDDDDDYDDDYEYEDKIEKTSPDSIKKYNDDVDKGYDDDDDDDENYGEEYKAIVKKGEAKQETDHSVTTNVVPSSFPSISIMAAEPFPHLDKNEEAYLGSDVYIESKQSSHVGNIDRNDLLIKELRIAKSLPTKQVISFSSAVPLGIAVSGVTVFVVIVIGAVAMTRRANKRCPPRVLDMKDVNPSVAPEEQHVTNMQINGYENPTYKYFEMNTK